MENARIAGVADRADARSGDMRDMPFHDGEFDAVVSSYAIDHLRRDDLVKGLSEVARVLKPHGEFLVLIVNPDWLTWVVAPPVAHHPRPDPVRWRSLLEQAGLAVVEEGTKPATLYFLAQKRAASMFRLCPGQGRRCGSGVCYLSATSAAYFQLGVAMFFPDAPVELRH